MSTKEYVTPQATHDFSYRLAKQVHESGFKPDFMIALWRGGAPVGCYVHEYLKWQGTNADHVAIRTSHYDGVDQVNQIVRIHNLGYLSSRLTAQSKVLIVDDVFDTGITIRELLRMLKLRTGDNFPQEIRVATLYYKPTRNQTNIVPNYFVHETDKWIVFSHELEGLSPDEVREYHGDTL